MAEPPTGEGIALEPLVTRVLAPNPSAFTHTGTQSFVVGGAGAIAVIDPGPDSPAHLDALERAIGGRPVAAIVCTHTHRDHSPAARPLAERTGAPIVGCAALTMDDAGPRADAAFDAAYRPDRVLADGAVLAGDGWSLEAVATPGHTSNHLAYALRETGALFSGDHVMGWSTTVVSPPDGDMAAYMASLERLLGRADRVYYPAHGQAVENPQRFVRGLLGHRRAREGQILRLVGAGVAAVPQMVERMYGGIDRRLFPAAEQSVLAHLIDLRTRGAVRQGEDGWRAA